MNLVHHLLPVAHRAGSSQLEGREQILIGEQYPLVEMQHINETAINYLYPQSDSMCSSYSLKHDSFCAIPFFALRK